MEEFFLSLYFTGYELNIVHHEQVGIAVFIAELGVFTALDGVYQLVGEFITLDVNDAVVLTGALELVADGIEQVSLAKAGAAVNEKGIIGARGLARYGLCRGVGELVGGAYNEAVKGEAGIIEGIHAGFYLACVVGILIVGKNHYFKVAAAEYFLQGLFYAVKVNIEDNVAAEFRRTVKDEHALLKLNEFAIAEPGIHSRNGKIFFKKRKHGAPNFGGRVHIFRPFLYIRYTLNYSNTL